MASTEISFIPDFEELDKQIQEEDFQTEMTVDTATGGGQGGGSGVSTLVESLGLAEMGSDVGTGPNKGGMFGQIAGGISKITVMLAAVVGFLAMLEPIQQFVSYIFERIELIASVFISVLTPVLQQLEKLMVGIIRFFRNPAESLKPVVDAIKGALQAVINSFIGVVNGALGTNIQPVSMGGSTGGVNPNAGYRRVSGSRGGGTASAASQAGTIGAANALFPGMGAVLVNPVLAGLSGEDQKQVVSSQSSSTQSGFLGGSNP